MALAGSVYGQLALVLWAYGEAVREYRWTELLSIWSESGKNKTEKQGQMHTSPGACPPWPEPANHSPHLRAPLPGPLPSSGGPSPLIHMLWGTFQSQTLAGSTIFKENAVCNVFRGIVNFLMFYLIEVSTFFVLKFQSLFDSFSLIVWKYEENVMWIPVLPLCSGRLPGRQRNSGQRKSFKAIDRGCEGGTDSPDPQVFSAA